MATSLSCLGDLAPFIEVVAVSPRFVTASAAFSPSIFVKRKREHLLRLYNLGSLQSFSCDIAFESSSMCSAGISPELVCVITPSKKVSWMCQPAVRPCRSNNRESVAEWSKVKKLCRRQRWLGLSQRRRYRTCQQPWPAFSCRDKYKPLWEGHSAESVLI